VKSKNENQDAVAIEIPDGATIAHGAQYGLDPFKVYNEDPDMRYYWAADDNDKMRPDGAFRVGREQGYKVSSADRQTVPGHVLMEIPREVWERRQAQRTAQNDRNLRDSLRPRTEDGQEVLAGRQHGIR